MALINCSECNKEISESAHACPNCGVPLTKGKIQFKNTQQSNYREKRQVSFLLGVGIFFFPIIFVWFLLRKGHSILARVIGFGYVIVSIVVSLVMSVAIAETASQNNISRASSHQSSIASIAPAEVVELARFSNLEIERDYEANTVSADQKYKNKRFIVSGTISSINTDFTNSPYIEMATTGFLGTQAYFSSGQESMVAALQKGQQVSLACTGKGDVAKTPMLRECVFSN